MCEMYDHLVVIVTLPCNFDRHGRTSQPLGSYGVERKTHSDNQVLRTYRYRCHSFMFA